ncbi:RAS1 protein, partial [Coemansia erecta]
VGKSMLTTKYINGKFSDDYDPTIEDSYRKQCHVDGETCALEILDTAGQEEYAAMRDYQIRSGDCFVIVYSITDLQSFEEAKVIAKQIPQIKEMDRVPMVLVGNKCDRTDRYVTSKEGVALARQIRSGFYEASAREDIHVNDVFVQCVRRIKTYRKLADPPSNNGTPTKQQDAARTMSFREQRGGKGSGKSPFGSKSWIPTRKSSTKAKVKKFPDTHMSMPDYYMSSFAPASQPRASMSAADKKRQSKRRGPDLGAKMSISSPMDSKRFSSKANGQPAGNNKSSPSSNGNGGSLYGDYTLVDIVKKNGGGDAAGGLPNIRMPPGRQDSLKPAPDGGFAQPTKRRVDHTSLSVVECGSERHVFLNPAANFNKTLPTPIPANPPKLQAAIRQPHRQKASSNCPIL